MVIGITGKSGSGKSTVCTNIESRFKWHVIDVDIIHKYFSKQKEIEIINIFEKRGYPKGDFDTMIKVFFDDVKLRQEINTLLFPLVYRQVDRLICDLQKTNAIIVLDAPLIFEMGLDKLCGIIGLVECKASTNIRRLMQRNKLTKPEALSRYNAINFDGMDFDFYIRTDEKE
jgi:dephospho-CoA kinase